MGTACETKCVHGTPKVSPNDNLAICACDNCYSGISCEMECSGRGTCTNDTCDCGFDGWRGKTCESKGCPGWGSDCSGHGTCIAALGHCYCRPGWAGRGCEIPQCPGGGNCSEHGLCDGINHDPPVCITCDPGYKGTGCDQRCFNGTVVKLDNSEVCQCDACFTGIDCSKECNGRGTCQGKQCVCQKGWRGDRCEIVGCPGIGSDCSGHGDCLAVNQECDCYRGWKGR